jgi:hypothetical protein
LIETTGEVKSRLLTVQNASSVTTATISTGGNVNCTGLNANAGNVISGQLTILDATYATTASISNAGDITGKSINGVSVNASATMKTPSINSSSLTTDLDIAPDQSSGNINIGNPSIMVTQEIRVKRPMTIQYLPSISYDILGGSPAITSFGFSSVATGTVKTIGTITGVSTGIYLIFYSINYKILLNTITFTKQEYGITSTLNTFGTTLGNCYDLETTSQQRLADVGGSSRFTVTKCGTLAVPGTTTNIRLTFGAVYTPISGSVDVNGTIKLMRIG